MNRLSVIVLFFAISSNSFKCSKSVYHALQKYLLKDYDPTVQLASVDMVAGPVETRIEFHLEAIADLVEELERLGTYGYLRLEWKDQSLIWNRSDFDVDSILLYQSKVWTPDIILENAVSSENTIGHENMLLRVYCDGTVVWSPSGLFWTVCPLDIHLYPFDTQTCTLHFAPETSNREEIQLLLTSYSFTLDEYSPHGQWDLVNSSVEEANLDHVSLVTFTLTLKRRSLYFVNFLVFPIISLSLLTIMVFYLPAEGGEKMTLSVSVMLSFIVFLTIFADKIPKSSIQTSLFVVYVSILVALSVASVIMSTINTNWYNKPPGSTAPRHLKFLVFFNRKRNRINSSQVKQDCGSQHEIEENLNWIDVARGLDRLCLLLFSFFTLLLPLTIYIIAMS